MTKREQSLHSDIPQVLEIHSEGDELRITFAVEIKPENLAAAFYMDGSASMDASGNYGTRGLFAGFGRKHNPVQDAMQEIVPFISALDANGSCRTAYWATGSGQEIEVIGELTGDVGSKANFPGPRNFGNTTFLLPAVRDFVSYVSGLIQSGEVVKRAFAVVVTDGQLHDFDAVVSYVQNQLAPAMQSGKFPPTNITLVGVGRDVDEEQLEELEHEATPHGLNEIFHAAIATEMKQLPELVGHLVDEQKPAFFGGATVTDDQGNTLAAYEDMVPAVLVLNTKGDVRSVTVRPSQGEPFTLNIPEGHDD